MEAIQPVVGSRVTLRVTTVMRRWMQPNPPALAGIGLGMAAPIACAGVHAWVICGLLRAHEVSHEL
jgi:hypothetical protein